MTVMDLQLHKCSSV